jgi:hypothetical protein
MSLLGQYYLAAIFATVFLWEQGLIHASQKVNLLNVIPSAASDYIWALAKLVPVIEITDTLNWTRPEALSDDRLQNLLLLTFKLALIVPIVQYITHIVRRRSESELERVINRPPFLSAVTRHKGIQYAEPDWSRVFDDAATYLNAAGVKTPEQTEWNGSRVRAALSDFYTFQP